MTKKHKSSKSKAEVAMVIAGTSSFGSRQAIILPSIAPAEEYPSTKQQKVITRNTNNI